MVGAIANLLTGVVLDIGQLSRTTRSKAVYTFILLTITASWTWNAIVEVKLSAKKDLPDFDIGSGAFFNSAFTVYLAFKFFYEVLQTYIYWLMAEIKGAQHDGDISRTTGILRSWESIGSTIAYAVGATHWSNRNQMILGFALWGFTIIPTAMAVFGDWNQPDVAVLDKKREESDVESQNGVTKAGEEKKN